MVITGVVITDMIITDIVVTDMVITDVFIADVVVTGRAAAPPGLPHCFRGGRWTFPSSRERRWVMPETHHVVTDVVITDESVMSGCRRLSVAC